MKDIKRKGLALLLAIAILLTMAPVPVLAETNADPTETQITNIKEENGKQVVLLDKVKGESDQSFFRSGLRFFATAAGTPTNETVEQTIHVTLTTLGLNEDDEAFEWSSIAPDKTIDVTIKVVDPTGFSTEKKVTFSENTMEQTITLTLPAKLEQAAIIAEVPLFDKNIELRAYKSGDSTSGVVGESDLTYRLEIMQIAHPMIKVIVQDPYGKPLQETLPQALEARLTLAENNDIDLTIPQDVNQYNIREQVTGDDLQDLNAPIKDSKLTLTTPLKDNKLTVGDKSYKFISSAYDVKQGGSLVFATQPTVVQPQPGDNGELPNPPEGYVRVTFDPTKDGQIEGKTAGEKVVYDVLKDTTWDAAKAAGLQIPAGPTYVGTTPPEKVFDKWGTEVQETGTGASKVVNLNDIPGTDGISNATTFTAYFKDKYSNQDIIPYNPTDPKKPTDPNDPNIPKNDKDDNPIDQSQYNIIAFKIAESDKDKGNLTLGDQQAAQVISVLVKKGSTWDKVGQSAVPTVALTNAQTTKHTGWTPAIPATGEVADKSVYTATFITDGQEITPGTELPEGVFEVSITRDEASIKDATGQDGQSRFGKSYAVFENSKLSKDKFPDLVPETNYKDPKWNVDQPWDQAITKKTDFKASAISSNFDKDNITGIEIVKDPTKMTYTEGDKPNHAGIQVKLVDKNKNEVIVEKDRLDDYGITLSPAETETLTVAGNNGKPIVAKVTGKDADGQPKELTANSKTNLTVNDKDTSAEPEVTQPTAGDKTISGKGVKGAEIKVSIPGVKEPITTTVGDNGEWTVNVPADKTLTPQEKITVTQTEPNKKPADKEVTVKDKDTSKTPEVTQPTAGDKTISGKGVKGAEIKVTIPGVKEPITTTVGDNGEWTINVPADKTLTPEEKITVTQTEPNKKPADKEVTVKDKDTSKTPEVTQPTEGDKTIKGKGVKGAEITVVDKDGKEIGKTKVDDNGDWTVKVPDDKNLKTGEKITVTQTEPGKKPADKEVTVKAKKTSGGSGGSVVIPSEPDSKPGESDLNKDDHYQYLIGYPDGTFAPNRGMTRAEVATMFTRLLKDRPVKGESYTSNFTDVSADDWYANTVGYAVKKGIVSGYPDGSFKPNQPITRAEFSSIAARFAGLTDEKDLTFTDLDASHWGYKAIRLAASHGWISGYPDNTFRPEQDITRAEVTSITNRMLNRSADLDWIDANMDKVIQFSDVARGDWFFEPVMEATMGHDFTRDADGKHEHWTGLNSESFI